MKYTGYVKKINTKSGQTSRGKPWTNYSAILLQESGAETPWLAFGFNAPPFQEADYAEVEASEGKYGLEVTAAKKLSAPAKAAAPASPQASAPKSSGYVDRNDSIVYQSSRKDAIQLVGLLLEHNALPMSTAAAKAGVAKRYEEITEMVDKLTVEYYFDVTTLRNLQTVVDSGGDTKESSGADGVTAETGTADND